MLHNEDITKKLLQQWQLKEVRNVGLLNLGQAKLFALDDLNEKTFLSSSVRINTFGDM